MPAVARHLAPGHKGTVRGVSGLLAMVQMDGWSGHDIPPVAHSWGGDIPARRMPASDNGEPRVRVLPPEDAPPFLRCFPTTRRGSRSRCGLGQCQFIGACAKAYASCGPSAHLDSGLHGDRIELGTSLDLQFPHHIRVCSTCAIAAVLCHGGPCVRDRKQSGLYAVFR